MDIPPDAPVVSRADAEAADAEAADTAAAHAAAAHTPSRADTDIASRADLERLLRRFYGAAFADPVIGHYFTRIAGTDLDAHLPHIADFWERALFRTADYRRNPLAVHAVLHAAEPLTAAHFGRWVQLWRATVDGMHRGERAERAKAQGERIALSLLRRLQGAEASTEGEGTQGFVPLAALELRVGA